MCPGGPGKWLHFGLAAPCPFTTGEGKPKLKDEKETTVYKRAAEVEYKLKLKASRAVFSEISKRPVVPFTIRALTGARSVVTCAADQHVSLGLQMLSYII